MSSLRHAIRLALFLAVPVMGMVCAPAAWSQVYYNFTEADLTIGGTTYDSYALDNTYATITSNTTTSGSGTDMLFTTKTGGIGNLADAIAASTGSGMFTRVFDMQNNTTERGYNASVGYDPSVPSQNNPLGRFNQGTGNVADPIMQPDQITTVTIGGRLYFEFMLDGGESDSKSALSIDELMIFTSSTNIQTAAGSSGSTDNPTPKGVYDLFKAQDSNVKLIYSLDEFDINTGTAGTDRTLLINLIESGNGDPDFAIYVPVDAILTGPNDPARYNDRIYLWVEHGTTGTLLTSSPQWGNNYPVNFDSSSTFEEWAYYKNAATYADVVPEPGVYVTGFLLIGLAGIFEWNRRRKSSASEENSGLSKLAGATLS